MDKQKLLEEIENAAKTQLRHLKLNGKDIGELPAEIGKLINLEQLTLYNNRLVSLPPEVGKLTNLWRIDLDDNRLESLPPEIGKLTNLKRLYLGTNQLKSLPPEIGELTKLEWLSLENNQLEELPTTIKHLSNLTRLYLHQNPKLGLLPEVLGATRQDVKQGIEPANPDRILEVYFQMPDDSSRKKNDKGPWYKTIWAIIGYIILTLGGIWTTIQIYESRTFQEIVSHSVQSQSISDTNDQINSNAIKNPSKSHDNTSKSLPVSNLSPPESPNQ